MLRESYSFSLKMSSSMGNHVPATIYGIHLVRALTQIPAGKQRGPFFYHPWIFQAS